MAEGYAAEDQSSTLHIPEPSTLSDDSLTRTSGGGGPDLARPGYQG